MGCNPGFALEQTLEGAQETACRRCVPGKSTPNGVLGVISLRVTWLRLICRDVQRQKRGIGLHAVCAVGVLGAICGDHLHKVPIRLIELCHQSFASICASERHFSRRLPPQLHLPMRVRKRVLRQSYSGYVYASPFLYTCTNEPLAHCFRRCLRPRVNSRNRYGQSSLWLQVTARSVPVAPAVAYVTTLTPPVRSAPPEPKLNPVRFAWAVQHCRCRSAGMCYQRR